LYQIYTRRLRIPREYHQLQYLKKIAQFQEQPKEGSQKCPVYLQLTWIGNVSLKFEKQTISAIKECYNSVQPRIIFSTKKILPAIYKDHVPTTQQCMVVYQYVCHCNCRYMGRNSLRLQGRINQHIPKFIRIKQIPTKILPKRNCKEKIDILKLPQCDSTIGLHLLQNKECANNYNDQQFSILARARVHSNFQQWKPLMSKPSHQFFMCSQKEFVYTLPIFH